MERRRWGFRRLGCFRARRHAPARAVVGGTRCRAAVYAVYAAPTLLADVLVDGTISAGLYRRLRQAQGHTWWEGAIRRTLIPAAMVLVTFVAAGSAIHHAWPDAVTLRDAWDALRNR